MSRKWRLPVIKRFLASGGWAFRYLLERYLHIRMSDEDYLKGRYKILLGEDLNLENPRTFNEKLQWLKLYDRRPEYTQMVDKYRVKEYVAERIGAEHVIPLLGVWDAFEEIDFDRLPNQFILKCTHNSGGGVICLDKSRLDIANLRKKFSAALKRNHFWHAREWPYKNVKPRIIAEQYIDSLGKPDSVEYKLTCFYGKAKLITICTGIAHDSFDKRTNDHYDRDFHPIPFWVNYKHSVTPARIPEQIGEIIELSERLSAGIPEVRVDSYLVGGHVYFGEMTFFTWSGFMEFNPPEWNEILGGWLDLPPKYQG